MCTFLAFLFAVWVNQDFVTNLLSIPESLLLGREGVFPKGKVLCHALYKEGE